MYTMPLPTLHATTDICSYIFTSTLTKFTLNQASNQQQDQIMGEINLCISRDKQAAYPRENGRANLCTRLNYYKRILKNRQHWQN